MLNEPLLQPVDSAPTGSEFADLAELAGLKAEVLPSILFGQYLRELHLHPERALTAAGRLVAAIEAKGRVKVEEQPEIVRARLRRLQLSDYALYNAFEALRGQQVVLHRWVEHLRAAANGGEVAKLTSIFKGKTGTGKTQLVEIVKELIAGQVVYHVEGCPVHESPLALLKLLPRNNLLRLLDDLKLTTVRAGNNPILEIIDSLGLPCGHCHGLVMRAGIDPNLALFQISVLPEQITTYSFGVETLTTGGSVHSVLRDGSGGIADFGELFVGFENKDAPKGLHAQDLAADLHDALNDRRIPASRAASHNLDREKDKDGDKEEGRLRGWLPIDVVAVACTNDGAFDGFKKALGDDGGKYMRLMRVLDLRNITSVSEEVLAYLDHMVNPHGVHFDPLALQLLAWIAMSSRYADAFAISQPSNAPTWIQRARMIDGEVLEIPRAGTTPQRFWTLKEVIEEFDTKDGAQGINVPNMVLLLGEIIDRAFREGHLCVSTYDMLKFVKERFKQYTKSNGFWKDEKEVAEKVADKFLKLVTADEKPTGAEAIFRVRLKRLATMACAPDYIRLLDSYFARYWLHGAAAAENKETVFDPDERAHVDVDLEFLKSIEDQAGCTTDDERHKMRLEVNSWVVGHRVKQGGASVVPLRTDFERLDGAIRMVRDAEVAKDVERLLNDELVVQLTDEERVKRDQALEGMTRLGFQCDNCRKSALQYIKDHKVWSFEDDLK